jgi:hypothetical protein
MRNTAQGRKFLFLDGRFFHAEKAPLSKKPRILVRLNNAKVEQNLQITISYAMG